jgi:hypothetical protein
MGGYGGISTMNQDQRLGKFHPHKSVSRHEDRSDDTHHCKCLHCGATWTLTHTQYFNRDMGDMPDECRKDLFRAPDA